MRLLAAFVRHELICQGRSLRFRIVASAYVLLAGALPAIAFALRGRSLTVQGPGTYAALVALAQPGLTTALAAILCVDGITRERDDRSLHVVGLMPLSNAGYVLLRWSALLLILLPLTLVPPLSAAALATAAGVPPTDARPFLVPWLCHTLPVLGSVSALALGLGTIADGTIAAALAAVLLFGVLSGATTTVLARLHRRVDPPSYLGLPALGFALGQAVASVRGWGVAGWPATDAPGDTRATLELTLLTGLDVLGVSAATLLGSSRFLRRTRGDVRALPVRKGHPFEGLLRLSNRIREFYTPDPAPLAAERVLVALGLLAAGLGLAYPILRNERYRGLALDRYGAELEGAPEPTPASVLPTSLRVSLRLDGDAVRSAVALALRNGGASPVSSLAFTLSPALGVERLSVDGAEAAVTRRWDRVRVVLARPIDPGATATLEATLRGVPADVVHPGFRGAASFVRELAPNLTSTMTLNLWDFTASHTRREISARRVSLTATSLLPVPRYTPFVVVREDGTRDPAAGVPEESLSPEVEVSLDVTAPADLVLADACGALTRTEGTRARLVSSCTVPIGTVALVGGRRELLPEPGSFAAIAVLPGHGTLARLHLPALEDAAELARNAYLGLDPLRGAVIMETPPVFTDDPWSGLNLWGVDAETRPLGRTLLLAEGRLHLKQPLAAATLAQAAVAQALLACRPVPRRYRVFFRNLYGSLASARMSGAKERRAAVSKTNGYAEPILEAGPYDNRVWAHRAPAVLQDVRNRLGSRAFDAGLEAFLSDASSPGTPQDLLAHLSRAGGVSLDRVYRDYFVGHALPVLTLADVSFRRSPGDGYAVTGTVRNDGTGEAVCPIVLRTEAGDDTQLLAADTGTSVPFSFSSRFRPRSVLLDPERRCYRFERVGITDAVASTGETP